MAAWSGPAGLACLTATPVWVGCRTTLAWGSGSQPEKEDRGSADRPRPELRPYDPSVEGGYLVLVDPGDRSLAEPLEPGAYMPAARLMASLHEDAAVRTFDPAAPDDTLTLLRESRPRFVAFVLPPSMIEVDLCHDILEMATAVDDDLLVDFEYGFITGRDGTSALRFARARPKARLSGSLPDGWPWRGGLEGRHRQPWRRRAAVVFG